MEKQITALNETVVILNRKLQKSNELLCRWRNACIIPELFQELVNETDTHLKGGASHGLSEEGCKKDG